MWHIIKYFRIVKFKYARIVWNTLIFKKIFCKPDHEVNLCKVKIENYSNKL